jgi:hypothetical protein
MLKYALILVFILEAAFAARLSLDERRKKILAIVDEELAEVTRLGVQQNHKSPDTLLRVAELNLEKARIYREVENEHYLALPVEERTSVNKNEYFIQSTGFFEKANSAALVVVKKFPNYAGIGEVYYILAYNYKELGKNDESKKYFKLSYGTSRDPKINRKSKQALADFYYNDKKYAEAIPLYEDYISKSDDKWWTKDAFNLAWSYYRVRNYDRALSLMREVHKKSGGKYIDMRSQVERDIGIFFVDANRINEAIQFFENLNLDYTEQFIKIAETITSQGRFDQAEKLLVKVKGGEKNSFRRTEILIAELNLFDKFNKTPEHLSLSRELVKIHLNSPLQQSQFDKLVYQTNKKAAELQKAVTSDIYKSVPKIRRQKAEEAILYFELASQLNPKEKSEKIFFQGETAFAVGNFSRALSIYLSSFDLAKNLNDKKIISQSLEGMLSSLGQPTLPREVAEKNYVPVYSRYISVDSKSERASSIFVKLFNSQYDSGDISGAEETLAKFANHFPADYKTEEAMLAKVMDFHRKNKNYVRVKDYIRRINGGEFKVSQKYADALRGLITKIQIEGVQQSLEKGDKAVALKGYEQIYNSPESTQKAKINAAYNLAALYFEIGQADKSYSWAALALRDMEVGDVSKFADSFLSISSGLFLRQQFTQSSDLTHRIVAKLCHENSSNLSVAFKNGVYISLANGDIEKALLIRGFGKKCGIQDSIISEVSFEVLKDLAKSRRWETYESILKELESSQRNFPLLIKPYEELRRQILAMGNNEEARSIVDKQNQFYSQAKVQKLEIPVEALDLIAERMMAGLVDKKQKLTQIELAFPESAFNAALKAKLQILDQMASDANNIQKVGSGKGIVEAYKHVIDSYEEFGLKLRDFSPDGKAPEYVNSFRKAMSDVYGPILKNAKKQRNEIKKLIIENKILSFSNFSVLFAKTESWKRYFSEREAILMDRGGRK